MPSLLPGYEYDIFISYRQNDNRSGWVTDFVRSLETELASTIKQPVSIYFDSNPDHGLLETHQVNESLEGKLKCLIFIPILSQTYCDVKSFAWQHELLAFCKLAAVDKIGLNVPVLHGNVASRILPVRIHDIDDEDKQLFEKETGHALRSIPFIFKSAGVNRPLQADEGHRGNNINQTFYRDQINKVANTVKDILQSVRSGKTVDAPAPVTSKNSERTFQKRTISAILGAVLLVAVVYAASEFEGNPGSGADKSIAVLPFDNLSGDKEQEYFSNGMMDELLNQLVKIGDLRVISRTSSMSLKDSHLTLKEKAEKLGAAHVIEGSVQKSGSRVRITVQLIEAASDKHIWSETFDRELTDVFAIQTEVSRKVAHGLKAVITPEESQQLALIPTRSKEAFDYYLKAKQKAATNDYLFDDVVDLYGQAIRADSDFALAYVARATALIGWWFNKDPGWQESDQLAVADLAKAEEINATLPELKIAKARYRYMVKRDYNGAIEILDELTETYPNFSDIYTTRGAVERRMGRWKDALRDGEMALRLDPNNGDYLWDAARTCYALRKYEKAEDYFSRAPGGQHARAMVRLDRTGDVEVYLKDPAVDPITRAYLGKDMRAVILAQDSAKNVIVENQAFIFPKALTSAQFYHVAK
jgi:TolB-like protein